MDGLVKEGPLCAPVWYEGYCRCGGRIHRSLAKNQLLESALHRLTDGEATSHAVCKEESQASG